MNKINIALVGFGKFGQMRARIYNSNQFVQLVAICDLNANLSGSLNSPATLALHKGGVKFYTDLNEMLMKENNIDVIHVAVPASFHYDVVMRSLLANKKLKYIFVEKPLAVSLKQAQEMIDQAIEANTKITVGYTERFSPSINETRRILERGLVGKIVSLSAVRRGVLSTRAQDVGITFDLGIHDIDLMVNLGKSRVVEVYSKGISVVDTNKEDISMIMLKFENGSLGNILVDRAYSGRAREFEVNGSMATCRSFASDPDWRNHYLELREGFINKIDGLDYTELGGYLNKYKPEPPKIVRPSSFEEPAACEINSFITSLLKCSDAPVSMADAFATTMVAEAALESQRMNKAIKLDSYDQSHRIPYIK